MIRKIAALILCFTAIAGLAGAQELGVGLDGGLQGMRYTLQNGQTKLLPGGSLDVDYTFRIHNGLGLLTGITAGFYRTRATLPGSTALAYPQVDDQGSAFLYNVRLSGYQETQRTLAVTIPVLLQYRTDGDGVQWYIDAGGKLFLPANTNIQASTQQVSLSGYYPNYDLVVSDLPKHGFGTVNGWKSSSTTQLKPGAALSAGTGLSFGISPGVRLYAGVYVDYGLTVLKNNKDSMPLITYSSSGIGNVKPNGVFSTSYAGQPKLLSYGLQVRLTWGARTARHPARHKPADTARQTFQIKVQTTVPEAAGAALSDSEWAIIQQPVLFGIFGYTAIPETQTQVLDDITTILQRHPDLRISIEGHSCDGVGQAEDPKLGEARAKSVEKYFERKGIDRRRMDITYAKESEPSNTIDPAANYRNRRVRINPE